MFSVAFIKQLLQFITDWVVYPQLSLTVNIVTYLCDLMARTTETRTKNVPEEGIFCSWEIGGAGGLVTL